MNECSTISFDYSLVDKKTSELLKDKEIQLSGIYGRYSSEVGKVLFEAQQQLADYNNDGLFEKWYTSIGFKKRSVYNYINIYSEVQTLHGEQRDIFLEQPKSVQIEMSKPSAIKEVNQAVIDGNIKTHKEYKALEKQLKQQAEQHQRQLAEKDEVINKTYEQLEKAQQDPMVIEKEVIPDDYEQVKESNDKLATELDKAKYEALTLRQAYDSLISKQKEEEEGSKRYKELTEAIEEMEGKMTRGQKRIQAQKQVYELVDLSKDLLMKITPIPHLVDSDYVRENPIAKRELENIANQTRKFLTYLEEVLKEPNIIEGEFINE